MRLEVTTPSRKAFEGSRVRRPYVAPSNRPSWSGPLDRLIFRGPSLVFDVPASGSGRQDADFSIWTGNGLGRRCGSVGVSARLYERCPPAPVPLHNRLRRYSDDRGSKLLCHLSDGPRWQFSLGSRPGVGQLLIIEGLWAKFPRRAINRLFLTFTGTRMGTHNFSRPSALLNMRHKCCLLINLISPPQFYLHTNLCPVLSSGQCLRFHRLRLRTCAFARMIEAVSFRRLFHQRSPRRASEEPSASSAASPWRGTAASVLVQTLGLFATLANVLASLCVSARFEKFFFLAGAADFFL